MAGLGVVVCGCVVVGEDGVWQSGGVNDVWEWLCGV